ncbi:MAG: alpha/beta hydrolase [Roseburia sp.]
MSRLLEADDGEQVFIQEWSVEEAKAVIQIFHGYGEHSLYYEEFAIAANKRGFDVYLHEYRGHGNNTAAYLMENIFTQNVKDGITLNKIIHNEQTEKKVFLLGHSLGTQLGQTAIVRYPQGWDGAILIGLPANEKAASDEQVGHYLDTISKEIEENGENAPNQYITENVFAKLNDDFADEGSIMAVMTSDRERQQYYEKLPSTGKVFSNRFYKDFYLFQKERRGAKVDELENHDFPVLLLVGEDDVIADGGLAVDVKQKQLESIGFTDVLSKVYPKYRHSILQEAGRERVYDDIFDWINKKI